MSHDFHTIDIESPITEEARRAAAVFVQERITDPYDCAEILEMLGLEEP